MKIGELNHVVLSTMKLNYLAYFWKMEDEFWKIYEMMTFINADRFGNKVKTYFKEPKFL